MEIAKDRTDQPLVIGLGEVLWDILPTGRQFGGAPVNFAYHAAQCGAMSHAVSAVGDDPLGREILAHLDSLGILRPHVAVDSKHPTGTVTVALDTEGKPRYSIHEDVAWDYIPTTPSLLELAGRAEAVCFGTLAQRSAISRQTVRQVLAAVPRTCLRVFDINLRLDYFSAEILEEGLRNCDVLKLNDEELPVVARLLAIPGSEKCVMKGLLDRYGLTLAVLTKGSNGSLLVGRDGSAVHSGVPTEVVDTVGAGDAFTAAVTMGLLRGADLDAISEHANCLASYVCSRSGATPAMPASDHRADAMHSGLDRSSAAIGVRRDSGPAGQRMGKSIVPPLRGSIRDVPPPGR